MNYKYDRLRKEFILLHPKPKDLIDNLDQVLQAKGWQSVNLTEIVRTKKDQENYYWEQVMADLKCTEEIARTTARAKPSWHLWFCAVDFTSKIYTPEQCKFILDYLKSGRPGPTWEIFHHNIGRGSHFHVAFEDPSWKQRWSNQLKG